MIRAIVRAIVCLIIIYYAIVLPFILVMTVDLDMNTIPELMQGLTLYLAMSWSIVNSLVYLVLNQKIKSSFLNIVGKCFHTRNQCMT